MFEIQSKAVVIKELVVGNLRLNIGDEVYVLDNTKDVLTITPYKYFEAILALSNTMQQAADILDHLSADVFVEDGYVREQTEQERIVDTIKERKKILNNLQIRHQEILKHIKTSITTVNKMYYESMEANYLAEIKAVRKTINALEKKLKNI